MVKYLAARLVNVSKHAGGRSGQKALAKAHRRGTHGKAVRRRRLASQRVALASRKEASRAEDQG
jgi:hypothetical protein